MQKMLTRWLRAACGGLLLPAVTVGWAHAKDKVTWGVQSSAPFHITEGEFKNQGSVDQIQNFLQEKLTAYEHETLQAPIPRILNEIKNGNPWCGTGFQKNPERESFAYFSLPIEIRLPHQLIINRNRRLEFSSLGDLSLETLLQNPKLRTSFLKGRAYNPIIDELLLRYPPAESHSLAVVPLRMTLANRLDYAIEFPSVAFYTAKQLGHEGELIALPFNEKSSFAVEHMICPKTEWGRKVIEDVNTILRAERSKPQYRRFVESWNDESGIKQIRQNYDALMLKE